MSAIVNCNNIQILVQIGETRVYFVASNFSVLLPNTMQMHGRVVVFLTENSVQS